MSENNFCFTNEDDLLALSGIQHYAFCPRQWGLIHLERQWQEDLRTIEGRIIHERVHDDSNIDFRDGVITLRSIPLISYRLGLQGIADVVEFRPVTSGECTGMTMPGHAGEYLPYPVEYKRGKPKRDDRDMVQLCAQAICLEEMYGISIEEGSLFYGQTRRRVDVNFSPQLRNRVIELAAQMHEVFARGITPAAPARVRCDLCSLVDVCLPEVTRKPKPVKKYLLEQVKILDFD